MKKEPLIKLNRRGIIPGPNESENLFLKRADKLLSINGSKKIPKHLLLKMEKEYDCSPDWIPIEENRKGLFPWHAACTLLEYDSDERLTSVVIQAPPLSWPFNRWYTSDEILMHELIHVGRVAFEEPEFEEVLAYKMSPNRFRHYLGPFCDTIGQYPLPLAIFLGVGLSLAPITTLSAGGICSLVALNACRKKLLQLSLCESALKALFPASTARHILYRLTDSEIETLSKMNRKQTEVFLENKKTTDLRWHIIGWSYL